VGLLEEQNPDVFALYEVEGKKVFDELVSQMADYQFHITEGPQTQEVLVGARTGLTAFFTQKVEFKSGNSLLRPGALLTLTVSGKNYSILFLHTKSSAAPIGLGIRDDQFERALKFRKTLDDAAGGAGKANYLFLGDLNTMGMKYPFGKAIESDLELKKLDQGAGRRKMRRLSKNSPHTWSNGSGSSIPPSNLDHVVAAEHLAFRQFGGADIDVRGWPKLKKEAEQDKWIRDFSDHALLFLEVQK
jgi:hypothetical protein